eukprot:jgi/Psemu1/283025/fgenesh1_pg.18_\
MYIRFTIYFVTTWLLAIGSVPRANATTSSPSTSPSIIDDDRRSKITTYITNYNRCSSQCVTSPDTGIRTGCKGFAGDDCSFPYEICPDATTQCFGKTAVCTVAADSQERPSPFRYGCSCKIPSTYSIERAALVEEYEVEDCKNRVTEVCESGQTISLYAFCTNGGRCVELVDPGEPHPGCTCPGRFVGWHCEHRRGTGIEYRIEPSSSDLDIGEANEMELQQQERDRPGLWAIIPTVLVSLAAVGGLAYMAKIHHKFRARHDSTPSTIHLDPQNTRNGFHETTDDWSDLVPSANVAYL